MSAQNLDFCEELDCADFICENCGKGASPKTSTDLKCYKCNGNLIIICLCGDEYETNNYLLHIASDSHTSKLNSVFDNNLSIEELNQLSHTIDVYTGALGSIKFGPLN
jgi:hypothetical protein